MNWPITYKMHSDFKDNFMKKLFFQARKTDDEFSFPQANFTTNIFFI